MLTSFLFKHRFCRLKDSIRLKNVSKSHTFHKTISNYSYKSKHKPVYVSKLKESRLKKHGFLLNSKFFNSGQGGSPSKYTINPTSLQPEVSTPNYEPKKSNIKTYKKPQYSRKIENVLFTPWKHGQQREGVDVGACNIMNYVSHELHISRLTSKGIDDIPDVNFEDPLKFSELISHGKTIHLTESAEETDGDTGLIDLDTLEGYNKEIEQKKFRHLNVIRKGQEVNTKSLLMVPKKLTTKMPSSMPVHFEFEEGYVDNIEEAWRDELSYFYKNIFNQHQKIPLNENVLTVGGDHSIAIGSLISSIVRFNKLLNIDKDSRKLIPKSKRKYKMACIWVDAHCDINTWSKSETKNLHGMPVSFALGIENSFPWVNKLMGSKENNYEDGIGRLYFDDLYYWGIRDVDSYEQSVIEDNNVTVIKSDDKDEEILHLKSIIKEYDLIHCSLDVDGLDPRWCPSTGTPVKNGLNLYHVLNFLDNLMLSNKCMAIDLVEYNPLIGDITDKMITRDSIQQMLRILL